ncbi:MAG: NAD(P)/FAD-dependent oxidoreductase, partial [Gemmatimonadales bacterium]
VIEQGTLRGVRGEREIHHAPAVIVAAGAWSGRIDRLPRPLSVEPVRGQMISFAWPGDAPPAVIFGGHCCLLRRGDEMVVGATVEHAGFEVAATVGAGLDLRRHAARLYPALAQSEPIRSWVGLRPVTPDGLPIIGPEPRLPGLWYATGHGRNGMLLGGVTGELLARRFAGDAVPELAAFRPERFWEW